MKAIIVDLDGTLCDSSSRHIYAQLKQWDKFYAGIPYDPVNVWCRNIVENYAVRGYKILFVTGRSEKAREDTNKWLYSNLIPQVDYDLIMRRENDFRPSWIVKREIYENQIAGRYIVELCIDDMQDQCDMWRGLGLVALQCANYALVNPGQEQIDKKAKKETTDNQEENEALVAEYLEDLQRDADIQKEEDAYDIERIKRSIGKKKG